MARTIQEKRQAQAEASRRWRAAHPERAKQVERDAYHRRREEEGKPARLFDTPEVQREKSRARSRRYYHAHREVEQAKRRAYYRENQEEQKADARVGHLKRLYGLTLEQFHALGTACGICGADEDSRIRNGRKMRLAVDHDHATGNIRGVLCSGCNCGIGYFKHDIMLMQAGIDYLRRTA